MSIRDDVLKIPHHDLFRIELIAKSVLSRNGHDTTITLSDRYHADDFSPLRDAHEVTYEYVRKALMVKCGVL